MRIKNNKRKISFSKILLISILIICLEIIVFAEVTMYMFRDLSSLYALIGIVAGLSISIWAYCEKSKAENTEGGIVYDATLKNNKERGGNDESSNR